MELKLNNHKPDSDARNFVESKRFVCAAGYIFKLSEEVSLEKRLLSLLLHRQPCKLPAALRFDTHPEENALANAAKDDVKGPRQQTGISVWT